MKFWSRISYFPVLFLLVVTIVITMVVTPIFAQSNNLSGIVYSPIKENTLFEDIVKDDISTISSFTENIRLYTIDDNTKKILEQAKTNHIKVTLGIDLANSDDIIQSNIQKAIKFAQDYPDTVDSIIVGNDAIAQKQVTINQLHEYLKFFSDSHIRISSANSPYIWQENPSLVDMVDYILLYSFDFWQGSNAQDSAQNAIIQYDKLKELYPGKSIILETGWPSDGTLINDAIPTEQEQSDYLQSFIALANSKKISYFVFEYANESWKPQKNNNNVENNWGLLLEDKRILKPYLVNLFQFASVKYTVEIDTSGYTQYKPFLSNNDKTSDKNKILKVSIPNDISSVSYTLSDQTKTLKTDGKQTVLFIESRSDKDNITIMTDKYSDKMAFSLIPQAFAACDVDAVCYEINQNNNWDYFLSIFFTSITLCIIFVIILRKYIYRSKEWDSIIVK
jgi:exo-beta-1,3-glucanase (GH17 family)